MIPHKNFVSFIASSKLKGDSVLSNENDVYLSYLPMPHLMERINIACCIFGNSSIYIYSGDITKLKDDLLVTKKKGGGLGLVLCVCVF